jgi:hypothetical protein
VVTRIPLTRGLEALVDDEDAAAVLAAGPWSAFRARHRTFYARRTVYLGRVDGKQRGTSLYLHRLLVDAPRVDHVNGNGLDCRRANLRSATHADNMRNRRTVGANNTSGYKGVTWDRRCSRWRASITVNRRHLSLGGLADPVAAARAYDAAAVEHFGGFARTNFPTVPAGATP